MQLTDDDKALRKAAWKDDQVWKKFLLWVGIIVVGLGIIAAGLVYWKNSQDSTITYRVKPSDDTTRAILVVKTSSSITATKSTVTRLFRGMPNVISGVMWVTTQPDSFGPHDPVDPRIFYSSAPTYDSATVFMRQYFLQDSINSLPLRLIYYTWNLDNDEMALNDSLVHQHAINNAIRVTLN